MREAVVVEVDALSQDLSQRILTQDQEVIQTLTSYGTDGAFGKPLAITSVSDSPLPRNNSSI